MKTVWSLEVRDFHFRQHFVLLPESQFSILSVVIQRATSPLCCVCVQMKSNGCVKVLFAAILPLPFVTCHQKEKENASMACLLSPSKRPFQDTCQDMRQLDQTSVSHYLLFINFSCQQLWVGASLSHSVLVL